MLKCENDAIEDFMKFYDLYVPNIYIPEPVVMEVRRDIYFILYQFIPIHVIKCIE